MKNQYFADINDYRKYGLLRQIAAAGLETTVAWMLTPDDGSSDGRRLGYLDEPERWERYDPLLFASLKALVGAGARRRVALVEGSGVLLGARFYSKPVPGGRGARDRWLEGLLERARGRWSRRTWCSCWRPSRRGCALEPGEALEAQEELPAVEQQPEAVLGDVGDLRRRSGRSRYFGFRPCAPV